MFLQGNPGMPSGHIPVYCLCILAHNAHQFPGATSDHLNMYVSIVIIKTSKKTVQNYSSPQHSPTLHPQTRWRDSPACPSCSRRSIWPSFCVWFKFSSINLPSTSCNYLRFPLLSSNISIDVSCKYYPIWNPLKAMRLALAVLYIESAVTKRPTRKEYSSTF